MNLILKVILIKLKKEKTRIEDEETGDPFYSIFCYFIVGDNNSIFF